MHLSQKIWRWAFYDFANSSYVLIFQSFLLPVFFSTVLLSEGYSLSAWGLANGISTVLGVILAIACGIYADRSHRLSVFKWIIWLCCAGMVSVSFLVEALPSGIFYAYIFTNALFIASLSLSDSILPHVAPQKEAYQSSGFAWGFGYLGGIVALVLVVVPQKFSSEYSPLVFLSIAAFYLIFSLHALNGLKQIPMNLPQEAPEQKVLPRSSHRTLLVGYWLISESITVIILFFSIFAKEELGFSTATIGLSLLFVQLVGFPATWLGGYLAQRFPPLSLLGLSILCWGMVIFLMISHPSVMAFVLVVFLTGLAIGNSQSLLRAQYSTVINKGQSGYHFGVYAFVSQAATSIGPVLYGIASDTLGSQKLPMVILFVLMCFGFLMIRHVMRPLQV